MSWSRWCKWWIQTRITATPQKRLPPGTVATRVTNVQTAATVRFNVGPPASVDVDGCWRWQQRPAVTKRTATQRTSSRQQRQSDLTTNCLLQTALTMMIMVWIDILECAPRGRDGDPSFECDPNGPDGCPSVEYDKSGPGAFVECSTLTVNGAQTRATPF